MKIIMKVLKPISEFWVIELLENAIKDIRKYFKIIKVDREEKNE